MTAAADAFSRRLAVKQEILLRLFMPLALLMGISRDYFSTEFTADLAEKVDGIPDEHLVSPAPSVAIPAMQGLSYSLDEPDLKGMYLNLLATAADDRRSDEAHPSFAEIIKQLTPREASELPGVLSQQALPIVRLRRAAVDGQGGTPLLNHLLPFLDLAGQPEESPLLPVWVDNWIRLGLVDVDYSMFLVGENAYEWVVQRPEYARLAAGDPRGEEAMEITKGRVRPTDFGRHFHSAVSGGG